MSAQADLVPDQLIGQTVLSLSGAAAVPCREPNLHHLQALMDDDAPTRFVESSLLWGDLGERFPQFRTELTKAIQGFSLS